MRRTRRIFNNGRYWQQTVEQNSQGHWVVIETRHDPNQSSDAESGDRTSTYYDQLRPGESYIDFQEAKRRGERRPNQAGMELPKFPTIRDPLAQRKHIPFLGNQRLTPDQEAEVRKGVIAEAKGPWKGPRSTPQATLNSQAIAFSKTLAQAELIIFRQALNAKAKIEIDFFQRRQKITAAHADPGQRNQAMQAVLAEEDSALQSLGEVLRHGPVRRSLASALVTQLDTPSVNRDQLTSLATKLVQNFLSRPVSRNPAPVARQASGSPITDLHTAALVAAEMAKQSNTTAPPAPVFRTTLTADEALKGQITHYQQMAKGISPLGGMLAPADRQRAAKILIGLRQLDNSWQGKPVRHPEAMKMATPATRLDVVRVAEKNFQWWQDADRMANGTSGWAAGSQSRDPEVAAAFARAGVSVSGFIDDAPAIKKTQDAIDRYLRQSTATGEGRKTTTIRNFFTRTEDAHDKRKGLVDYTRSQHPVTGQNFDQRRTEIITHFLEHDPNGREIRKRYKSTPAAVADLKVVIGQRAMMVGFQRPMAGVDLTGSGGVKTGYEEHVREGPDGRPMIDPGHLPAQQLSGVPRAYTTLGEQLRFLTSQRRSLHATQGAERGEPLFQAKFGPAMAQVAKIYGDRDDRQSPLAEAMQQVLEGDEIDDEGFSSTTRNPYGQSGLVKGAGEYEGASKRWTPELTHNQVRLAAQKFDSAKMIQIRRIISGVGQAVPGGEVTENIVALNERKRRQAERVLLTDHRYTAGVNPQTGKPTERGEQIAQFLGTSAGSYDLFGSKSGAWGETVHFSNSPKQVGRALLEDERRHMEMEEGIGNNLNREDTMSILSARGKQFLTRWRDARNAGREIEDAPYSFEIPSTPYRSLHPAARGATTQKGLYQALAMNTQSMLGINEATDLPMGQIVSPAQSHSAVGFFPGNPLFGAFQSQIETGDWQADAGLGMVSTSLDRQAAMRHQVHAEIAAQEKFKAGSGKDLFTNPEEEIARRADRYLMPGDKPSMRLRASEGFHHHKSLLLHNYLPGGENTQMDPRDFVSLLRSRAGIKSDEYGRAFTADGEPLIAPGKDPLGRLSAQQTAEILHSAFPEELHDWGVQAGFRMVEQPDHEAKGTRTPFQIAEALVQSHSLERILGTYLKVGHLTRGDRGPGSAPFGESADRAFHPSDMINRKLPRIVGDLFAPGRYESGRADPLTPDWGQDANTKKGAIMGQYREAILAQRGQLGLWTPEMEAQGGKTINWAHKRKGTELQNRYRHLTAGQGAISNWIQDSQLSPLRTDVGMTNPVGLLHEAGLSHLEDKWEVLAMNREARAHEYEHMSLEQAAPQLYAYATGMSKSYGDHADMGAVGSHAPPGQRQLTMSAVLNAAFEAIGGLGVYHAGKRELRLYQNDDNLKRFRQRLGDDSSTMTRAMISGESTAQARVQGGALRGVGIYGLETVEDAQHFQAIYGRLHTQYNKAAAAGKAEKIAFKAADLREIAELLGWNYDQRISPEGFDAGDAALPRNLLAEFGDDEKVHLQAPWSEQTQGASVFPNIGDTGTVNILTDPKKVNQLYPRALDRHELKRMYQQVLDPDQGAAGKILRTVGDDGIYPAAVKHHLGRTVAQLMGREAQPSRYSGKLGQRLKKRWQGDPLSLGAFVGKQLQPQDPFFQTALAEFGDWRKNDKFVDLLQRTLRPEMDRIGLKDTALRLHREQLPFNGYGQFTAKDETVNLGLANIPEHVRTLGDLIAHFKSTLHHESFHAFAHYGQFSRDEMLSLHDVGGMIDPDQNKAAWSRQSSIASKVWGMYGNIPGYSRDMLTEEIGAWVYERHANWGGLAGVGKDHPAHQLLADISSGRVGKRPRGEGSRANAARLGAAYSLPGNPSDAYPFAPDPEETVSPMDFLMRDLVKHASSTIEPLFDKKPGAHAMNTAFSEPGNIMGKTWTKAQRHAIGMGKVAGGAMRVVLGAAGSGKSDYEIARVLHQIKQGVPAQKAPVITSFANVSVDVTKARLAKAGIDPDTYDRYIGSGGVTTINSLGTNTMRALGMEDIFQSTGYVNTNSRGEQFFGAGYGDDFWVRDKQGKLMDQEALANHPQFKDILSLHPDNQFKIDHGVRFDDYRQMGKSHEIEAFRESVHELWQKAMHETGGQLEHSDLMKHSQGALPQEYDEHGVLGVRRGIRRGRNGELIADRERPALALDAELKLSNGKDTLEGQLWKNVQALANSGVHTGVLREFFDPRTSDFEQSEHSAKYGTKKGEMWLATEVLAKMDERLQRGSLASYVGEEGAPQAGLVRYYPSWDTINKPLHHLDAHTKVDYGTGKGTLDPEIQAKLEQHYGREFVVSEAQDANLANLRFIKAMAGGVHNMTLSGDLKQDLYPWRGGTRAPLMDSAEIAKSAGSFVRFDETHRFTGGTTDFVNKLEAAMKIRGTSGALKPMFDVQPMRPVGPKATIPAGPVAISLQPFGRNKELGGRAWEREVIAQQIREMTGSGVDRSGLSGDQNNALDAVMGQMGISRGMTAPGNIAVIQRSNRDVASLVEHLNARGVNGMAMFAKEKLSGWNEFIRLAEGHGWDHDMLEDIISRKAYDEFAQDPHAQGILEQMQGGGVAKGRYQGGGRGVHNVVNDIADAYRNLSLPHNGVDPFKPEGVNKHDYTLVSTIEAIKGDERDFVIMPDQIERLQPVRTEANAVRAREHFVKAYTSLLRGARGFLMSSVPTHEDQRRFGVNERDPAKAAGTLFNAVAEYQARGSVNDIIVGGEREAQTPGTTDWGTAPSGWRPAERRPRGTLEEGMGSWRPGRGYKRTFAGGGSAERGQIVVGEGNREEMVVTQHGAATVQGTHILDVDKLGVVEVLNKDQMSKAQRKGDKVADELLSGRHKIETALFGGFFGKQRPQVPQLEPTGAGLTMHFAEGKHADAQDFVQSMRYIHGLETSLISDPGKGHVAKVDAYSPHEETIAKAAAFHWEESPNRINPNLRNADFTTQADLSHKAYAGLQTGELMPESGTQARAFGKTAEQAKKMGEAFVGAEKMVIKFTEAAGDTTTALTNARIDKGLDAKTGVLTGDVSHQLNALNMDKFGGASHDAAALEKKLLGGPRMPDVPIEGSRDLHRFNAAMGGYQHVEGGGTGGGGGRRGGSGSDGFYGSLKQNMRNLPEAQWKWGVVAGMMEGATQDRDQVFEAAGHQARAINTAMVQGEMVPDTASPTFGKQAKAIQGFIEGSYNQDRDMWEHRGIDTATYAENVGTFMAAGDRGFSKEFLAKLDEIAKNGGDLNKFLSESPEGKAWKAMGMAANNIAFSAQQQGASPVEAIRMTRQLGNSAGVREQDAAYSEASFGIIGRLANRSPLDINEFMEGAKYIAPEMMPRLTGEKISGASYGSAESMGLSTTKADGSAKSKEDLLKERQGMAKEAEVLAVLAEAGTAGLTSAQAGRGFRSVVQSQYSMNDRQSWLYAKQTGVLDEQGNLTGVKTSDPKIYAEKLRQQQAAYGVEEQGFQLRGAQLSQQTLKIDAKSLNIQAQSVKLEAAKFAELAPVLKQGMIAGNAVENMQYQQSLRSAQFAVSLQPMEREVFQDQQAAQRNQLARTQREVAATRGYEDLLYGKPGTNRSYEAYYATQANQITQGQGGQNVGHSVMAAVNGVGLEAAQTYRGLDYQRTMLTLGQSQLNSGAAYAAQLKYIEDQKQFAAAKFGAEGDLRGTQRDIQDEGLKEQADLLPKIQELEKARFDESQRQAQEGLAVIIRQGDVLAANNAAFAINLKYYDDETKLHLDQAKLQEDEISNRKLLNKLQQEQNDALIKNLKIAIPLQEDYNRAFIDWMNGIGANKGRTDLIGNDAESGYQTDSAYISTLFTPREGESPGAEAERLASVFGEDMTAAPLGSVLGDLYSAKQGGDNRKIDQIIQDVLNNPEEYGKEIRGLQDTTPAAQMDLDNLASKSNALADAFEKIAPIVANLTDDFNRIDAYAKGLKANASPAGEVSQLVGGGPGMAMGWGIGSSIFGSMAGSFLGKGATKMTGGMLARIFGSGAGSEAAGAAGAAESGMAAAPFAAAIALPFIGHYGGKGIDKLLGHFGVDSKGAGSDIGTGAGIGAGVGMLVGGPAGAAIGAGVGALAGGGYWAATHPEEVKKAAKEAFDKAKDVFEMVKGLDWGSIKNSAIKALEIIFPVFGGIKEAWDHKDQIMAASGAAWETIQAVPGQVGDAIGSLFGIARDAVAGIWENILGDLPDIGGALAGLFGISYSTIATIWDTISEDLPDIGSALFGLYGVAYDRIAGVWDSISEDLPDIAGAIGSLFSMTSGSFTAALDWVSEHATDLPDQVSALFGAMGDVISGAWDALKEKAKDLPGAGLLGDIGDFISDHKAAGGYASGGMTLVGEEGAELVHLPKGSIVEPAARTARLLQEMAPSRDTQATMKRSAEEIFSEVKQGLASQITRAGAISLDPTTARNITLGQGSSTKQVEVNISIEAGAQIDQVLINRLTAETLKAVREAIED